MTGQHDQTATERGDGRKGRGHIALWVLQVLLALAFLGTGSAKLTGAEVAVAIFETMGTDAWLPYILGILEIVGGVALLVPRLTGLAASAFVVLLVGALLSHAIWGENAVLAATLLVLSAVVAWGRRQTTAALLASVTGR